jgi:hypothetical protein
VVSNETGDPVTVSYGSSVSFSGYYSGDLNERMTEELWFVRPYADYAWPVTLTVAGTDYICASPPPNTIPGYPQVIGSFPVSRTVTWDYEKYDDGEYRAAQISPMSVANGVDVPLSPVSTTVAAEPRGINWSTLQRMRKDVQPWKGLPNTPQSAQNITGDDWEVKTYSGKTIGVWSGYPG